MSANFVSPSVVVADANMVPKGYHRMVTITSARNVPGAGRILWLTAETQGVRIRDDGSDPTGTEGFLLTPGLCFKYIGNTSALRVIEDASGAILHVLAYD